MPKSKTKQVYKPRKNRMAIEVSGFNRTFRTFKEWLQSIDDRLKGCKIKRKNDNYIVKVQNEGIIENLLKHNNDVFDGDILSILFKGKIIVNSNGNSYQNISIKSLAYELVNRYFDELDRSIDLSSLHEKLLLVEYKSKLDEFGISNLFKCISDIHPNIISINYAHNKTNLKEFKGIHKYFPNLIKLSLENTYITNLFDLDLIKDIPLQHLTLTTNPIIVNPSLKEFIYALFPKLITLNGEQFYYSNMFNVSIPRTLPPISIGYFKDYNQYLQVKQFLQTYFETFNNNYSNENYYDQTLSTCSLTMVNKAVPHLSKLNRNLKTLLTTLKSTVDLAHIGRDKILNFHKELEGIKQNTDNVTFDCTTLYIDGKEVYNIVCFGECKYREKVVHFYQTFIVTNELKIINNHLHFFKCDAPFVVMKKDKDTHDAITDVHKKNYLDCDSLLLMVKELKFDITCFYERIQIIRDVIQSFNDVHQAYQYCRKFQWKKNLILANLPPQQIRIIQ
ncbi:NTF2 domain-containing protein [Entamoeba marina]